MLIDAMQCQLLVVDIQERLMPAMANGSGVLKNSITLMKAAKRLEVPILASEQYPKGLGPLVAEISAEIEPGNVLEKLTFSCAADRELCGRLSASGRKQIVICGVETHVCVFQSAVELSEKGLDVFVAHDACSSRDIASWTIAGERLRQNGVSVVTTEMVCFEWLRKAGTEVFRDVSKLVK